MGKKTDERLRSPVGNLRLHVSCFSPIKKATSFPLKPSAERGRSFYGNTAQMSWCDGECIFRQMRLQKSKVRWR